MAAALKAWVGLLGIAALWLAVDSLKLAAANLDFYRVAAEHSFWPRPPYRPTIATRDAMHAATIRLLERHRDYPDYLALAAYNRQWEWFFTGDAQAAREALALQRRSLRRRPAQAGAWRALLEYAQASGNRELVGDAEQRLTALDLSAGYHSVRARQ
jgi:hypothetical protein